MLDGITGIDALAGLNVDRPTAAGLYAGYRRSVMMIGVKGAAWAVRYYWIRDKIW